MPVPPRSLQILGIPFRSTSFHYRFAPLCLRLLTIFQPFHIFERLRQFHPKCFHFHDCYCCQLHLNSPSYKTGSFSFVDLTNSPFFFYLPLFYVLDPIGPRYSFLTPPLSCRGKEAEKFSVPFLVPLIGSLHTSVVETSPPGSMSSIVICACAYARL